jgi:preprotein translocase subunit SecF
LGFFITFIFFLIIYCKTYKMKTYLLTIATILLTTIYFAQEKVVEDISINGQFEKLLRISTNYQRYKVIDKEKFLQLRQNVLDSIKTSQNLVIQKNRLIKAEQQTIKRTQGLLNKTQLDISASLLREDSIFLFGVPLSNVNYSIILWTLILSLISALIYIISRFKKNNILTKEAKHNLLIVEKELEQHIKNSIEREQKLRRKLQDEINKQRNS